VQMWAGVSPSPAQMRQDGSPERYICKRVGAQSWSDVARREPNPDTDVGGGEGQVQAQMWQSTSPVAMQMWED
jgi:hypothetical protein